MRGIWRRPPPPGQPGFRVESFSPPQTPRRRSAPKVIVVANEKGGVGKSTVSALISTAMMYHGARVAVIDVDLRQQSLSHLFANRRRWLPAVGVDAPIPLEYKLTEDTVALADADPASMVSVFERALVLAMEAADIVVVDTPGGHTPLSKSAHLQADILVTPLNDSFVDFDMLGTIDPVTLKVLKPSTYSRVVHDSRRRRADYGRELDWVVLRNRLAATETRNRERVGAGIQALADQIGFRVAPGLRERVAYREMFPFGLTVADLSYGLRHTSVSVPRKAVQEEVQALLATLGLIEPDPAAD